MVIFSFLPLEICGSFTDCALELICRKQAQVVAINTPLDSFLIESSLLWPWSKISFFGIFLCPNQYTGLERKWKLNSGSSLGLCVDTAFLLQVICQMVVVWHLQSTTQPALSRIPRLCMFKRLVKGNQLKKRSGVGAAVGRAPDSLSIGNESESRHERRYFLFSKVNFLCWLLLRVCSLPVLPQLHVKDPAHSAKTGDSS